MKTIRTNCFETNSSSTHSITISKIVKNVDTPLAEARVLRLDILGAAKLHSKNTHGNNEWTVSAGSTDAKAALTIHYLFDFLERESCDDNLCAQLKASILRQFKDYCGYKEIILEDFWASYSLETYGEQRIDDAFTLEDVIGNSKSGKPMIDFDGLKTFIVKIVLNDEVLIEDTTEEY